MIDRDTILRGCLRRLSDAADDINGLIDISSEDERLELRDWPDSHEFTVTLPWKAIKAMDRAIYAAQRELASCDGIGSAPDRDRDRYPEGEKPEALSERSE